MLKKNHFITIIFGFLISSTLWAQSPSPSSVISGPQPSVVIKPLNNEDIKKMVLAGLDTETIVEKIKHSSVKFDTSIDGLIELKKALVPQAIVRTMLERPEGAPTYKPQQDIAQTRPYTPSMKPLEKIERILIKAPSEVMRAAAEKALSDNQGPVCHASEVGYDAIMIIGVDASPQQLSMWTGAWFCTAEGSLTIDISGNRLWSITDHERSATATKAAKAMIDRMVEQFVSAWKAARGKNEVSIPTIGEPKAETSRAPSWQP